MPENVYKSETLRRQVAALRDQGHSTIWIANVLGVNLGTLRNYINSWRRDGDTRFAVLPSRVRGEIRHTVKFPSCPWPRARQLAALGRAGLTAAEIAGLLGVKKATVHEVSSRNRGKGAPVPYQPSRKPVLYKGVLYVDVPEAAAVAGITKGAAYQRLYTKHPDWCWPTPPTPRVRKEGPGAEPARA